MLNSGCNKTGLKVQGCESFSEDSACELVLQVSTSLQSVLSTRVIMNVSLTHVQVRSPPGCTTQSKQTQQQPSDVVIPDALSRGNIPHPFQLKGNGYCS